MNINPGKHFSFPHFSRESLEYILPRGLVILLFSVVIGAIVIARPFLPGKWGLVALLGLVAFLGLLIIGNLKKVLLAVIIIDVPLRWDVYLGVSNHSSSLGAREGWLVSATTIALLGLFAIYLLEELVFRRRQNRMVVFENIPLILYMFFTLLSVVIALDPRGSFYQIFLLAQMYVLYVYVSNTITTKNDLLFIMFFMMVGIIFEGCMTLLQYFTGIQFSIAGIVSVIKSGRMAGTLGSPNTAAGYFSLLLAPIFALIFSRTSRWIRYMAVGGFFLGAIGLVLTVSRGGLIGFVISMIIFGLVIWLRGKISPWIAFVILFFTAAFITVVGGLYFDRIIGIRENAAWARVPLMQMAWKMIQSHPFIGVGANNYSINIPLYMLPEMSRSFIYVVHNKFLLVWAETGLGGILSFIGFLGLAIWRGWKSYLRDVPLFSLVSLGFAAAISGQMTHMMVEIFDSRSELQALWLAAALITAMERITRGEKKYAS